MYNFVQKGTHNWLIAPSQQVAGKVAGSIRTGNKDAPPSTILVRAVVKPYNFNCRW
jgi:hypothetical protein